MALSVALLLAAAAAVRAQTPATVEQAQPAARAVLSQAQPVLGADFDDGPPLRGDLPNFHEVEPGFYRLAQPTAAGVRELRAKYKVNTLLTLRLAVDKAEAAQASRLGMTVRNVKMIGILMPRFSEVDRALEILAAPAYRPVAVHCLHGRDRTGVVVAAYEVVRGKDPKAAAEEARGIGCCPPTFVTPLEKWLTLYKRHHDGDPAVDEPQDPLRR